MAFVEHPVSLRLRFGADAQRTINVPLEIRKGSYSQRYELYVDGGPGQRHVHIGWVVKHDGQWHSYLTQEQSDTGSQYQAGLDFTRKGAIESLMWRLGRGARTNVLARLAEEAYA